MGCALVRCALRSDNVELAAALEMPGHECIGSDPGTVAGAGETGLKITDDLSAVSAADVVIDFTFHTATPLNAKLAADLGKAMVIGTTGLDDDESATVKDASEKIPVVWAPNMSLGVNLLFEMVKRAAGVLGIDYDAEIVETHHRHKKDAPSGTALMLGEKIAGGRGQDFKTVACCGREGLVGERPAGQIGIHAVRSGDVVGEHTVSFSTEGERVEFSHKATNRDAFAIGALRAAAWVARQQPGLYDMRNVLGL